MYERLFGGGYSSNDLSSDVTQASGTEESETQNTDYEAQKKIEQQLMDTPIKQGYYALLKDESYGDNIIVLCRDGEATVSIVACANFAIPYVADMYLTAAQEAAAEAGVTLVRFDVNSYAKTSDGIAEESWASWQTKDGQTGILTDDTEGEAIVKPGLTIEQVYEYYADYKEVLEMVVSEAGGTIGEADEPDIFGDMLDAFQGEWRENGNEYSYLVISDTELNFIHENSIGDKEYRDVFTFYFSLDDNGELVVVNQHSQPRKKATIDENGNLLISSTPDGEVTAYEKVSDSTEVPEEILEPTIGMTALEVYASTWGVPKKVNKTTTATGEREQWVYEDGYIYFENGYVTAIQD